MTERELVTTRELTEAPVTYERALLRSRHTPARTGRFYQRMANQADVPYILSSISRSQYLSLDFETRGTEYYWNYHPTIRDNDVEVIGMGLAWDRGSAYLPWNELSSSTRSDILRVVCNHRGLIAHNVLFDGGILDTLMTKDIRGLPDRVSWHACTLVLFRLLSNEGYPGQKHGLKVAQKEILLWEETNEAGIDKWLVAHGYVGGNVSEEVRKNSKELLRRYQAGTVRPDKSEMWRVPHRRLGPYCILDAESAYLLYTEHLLPVLNRFPALVESFHKYWMHSVHLHIWQYIEGMPVDREKISRALESRQSRIEELTKEFRNLPETAQHILDMEKEMLIPLAAKEPERYKKLPPMPKEPDKYKKDGALSKNWLRWKENVDSGKYTIPVQSLNWENWKARWDDAVAGRNPDYQFNIQSRDQLAELLYRRIGYDVGILTDSGEPSTGADAVRNLGEPGRILVERDGILKEMGYLRRYLEFSEGDGKVHPQFHIAKAKTGRVTCTNPNIMQLPKTKEMMEIFVAPEGHTLVDLDFSALENVVAAELSECPNLWNLYGDNVPENDAHLFLAAHIPAWRDAIAATGYTPYNPPPGSVSKAKKDVKDLRSKAKTVVYAKQYGGGVDKVYQTLINGGTSVTYEEVQEVCRTYDELYRVVKEYSYRLQDEWWETTDLPERTRHMYKQWSRDYSKRDKIPRGIAGYVMNGLGRPMCINYGNLKDALSRVLQGTGHDILNMYILATSQRFEDKAYSWYPYLVDLHDASTYCVEDDYVEDACGVMQSGMGDVNGILQGSIQHRGVPTHGPDMSYVKEPED